MRLKTPITQEKLKHHWTYNGWKYLVALVATVLGWSLIYSVTAYRPPEEKRIDVYVLSDTTDAETVDAFLLPLWRAAAPEMELVSSAVIASYGDLTDVQLTAYLMTGEADIYFLTEQYFKNWAAGGAFLPLEELAAAGKLDVQGLDLQAGYVTRVTEYDRQDRPVSTESHLYGIPLDGFEGFRTGMGVEPKGMYAVIAVNHQNDEQVIPFFSALLQAGRGE